jgi:hypothetical protein
MKWIFILVYSLNFNGLFNKKNAEQLYFKTEIKFVINLKLESDII